MQDSSLSAVDYFGRHLFFGNRWISSWENYCAHKEVQSWSSGNCFQHLSRQTAVAAVLIQTISYTSLHIAMTILFPWSRRSCSSGQWQAFARYRDSHRLLFHIFFFSLSSFCYFSVFTLSPSCSSSSSVWLANFTTVILLVLFFPVVYQFLWFLNYFNFPPTKDANDIKPSGSLLLATAPTAVVALSTVLLGGPIRFLNKNINDNQAWELSAFTE